jgi:hypothetical protein
VSSLCCLCGDPPGSSGLLLALHVVAIVGFGSREWPAVWEWTQPVVEFIYTDTPKETYWDCLLGNLGLWTILSVLALQCVRFPTATAGSCAALPFNTNSCGLRYFVAALLVASNRGSVQIIDRLIRLPPTANVSRARPAAISRFSFCNSLHLAFRHVRHCGVLAVAAFCHFSTDTRWCMYCSTRLRGSRRLPPPSKSILFCFATRSVCWFSQIAPTKPQGLAPGSALIRITRHAKSGFLAAVSQLLISMRQ